LSLFVNFTLLDVLLLLLKLGRVANFLNLELKHVVRPQVSHAQEYLLLEGIAMEQIHVVLHQIQFSKMIKGKSKHQ
jgi:hypothetical protein